MLIALLLVVLALAIGVAVYAWALRPEPRNFRREHHIRTFVFPATMLQSLTVKYPALQEKDTQLAARALRQFFLVHARSSRRVVGMPSQVVDELWHRFILDTRAYGEFCRAAFGAFFHHIPSSDMRGSATNAIALRRTWRLACLEENINPNRATRLPLLFAIDSKLGIPGANLYTPETFFRRNTDGSSCGGDGGGGDDHGSSDGDGGSGCGGGCGGGD